mgnify:CR=1 FL=1|jgi:hypothetical protein|tara:strand:- start:97 stop:264 length:168 start_codon:yes stop_codon:yes gene_type:complete
MKVKQRNWLEIVEKVFEAQREMYHQIDESRRLDLSDLSEQEKMEWIADLIECDPR